MNLKLQSLENKVFEFEFEFSLVCCYFVFNFTLGFLCGSDFFFFSSVVGERKRVCFVCNLVPH